AMRPKTWITRRLLRCTRRRTSGSRGSRPASGDDSEIITATNRAAGRGQTVDPAWAGAMLLALEDGFRLHRLIDPDTTPADSFVRAVTELQRIIGLGRPSRRSKDDEVVNGPRR